MQDTRDFVNPDTCYISPEKYFVDIVCEKDPKWSNNRVLEVFEKLYY